MNKKEKIDKTNIEIKIDIIFKEVNKKNDEIINSPKYQFLNDKKSNLWKETWKKNEELRKLRKRISEKYVTDFRSHKFLSINKIKSSVKQGIKRGLGVKHINLIEERDIINIVVKLIENELEKSNEKEILSEKLKLTEEIDKIIKNQKELLLEVDILRGKGYKLRNSLNRDKVYLDKNKQKKRKEVGEIIKKDLPKFMGKIKKEVERGILLDNLN